ncbi:MAG: D-aminoacylase [Sandaracinaceae bacterium]|nr:D-aminoacylase [Sandaracinaceae bacterium]
MRLLIRNARIADGTGAPIREGDVLVEGEHVAEVFETSLAPDEVLDAGGMLLAPGFIDVHSHNDFTLPGEGDAQAKLLQGVTTEVVGNCGLGVTPANPRVEQFYALLSPMIFGDRSQACFEDLDAYRALLHERGISVNAAVLIPHGNVRCAAMGMEERQAREGELEHMRELVARQMEQGAFGLSTGLVYPPGAFAETEEVIELAKVAAAHRGIYATHMRDEGARLVQSVEETLRIGREANVSVQISHHKAAGRFNWGKVERTLRMVEEARAEGLDVHSDVYPYTAGSTVLSAMFVPLWAFEGSQEQLLERLRDPATRERMVQDSKQKLMRFAQLPGVLDRIFPKKLILPFLLYELSKLVIISSVKHQHHYEGKSLREIMRLRGQKRVYDTIFDLLLEEEGAVAAIAHVMSEKDVETVMKHPTTMLGTDGFPQREGKPHPRTYGTYPRVIEHYVRERGLLTMEQAIHKMTGMIAKKLRLHDRGEIRAGARADLVLLAPEKVRDRATYESPRSSPAGFAHVFVNGAWTVKDGRHTGVRAGRVLSPSAG